MKNWGTQAKITRDTFAVGRFGLVLRTTDHEKPRKTEQHGVVKGFVAFVYGIHDLGEGESKVLHSTLLLPGKEFRYLITEVL